MKKIDLEQMKKIDLEQRIKDAVDARGGKMHKIRAGNAPGFPGYMIILPGGHIGFAEIGEPEGNQLMTLRKQISELRMLGCAAMAIGSENQINRMMMYILSDAGRDPSWNAYQDYKASMIEYGKGNIKEVMPCDI